MPRHSLRRKSDLLFQDFWTRAKKSNLVCKAIRKSFHYSQATMAQKMHYGSMYLSDFENDLPLRPDVSYHIYEAYHKFVYELYEEYDTQDYISWCIRVICNYGEIMHEDDNHEDDELIKKFMTKMCELYPEFV